MAITIDEPAPVAEGSESTPDNAEVSEARFVEKLKQSGFAVDENPRSDDGGNKVEVEGVVKVNSTADAVAVVRLATEAGYGVMPMGALSSATNAFKAGKFYGRKGWIALEIQGGGRPSVLEAKGFDAEKYEAISICGGRARILKSRDKTKPHKLQTWAGVFPKDLDEAIEDVLGPGFSTNIDITSRDKATIGGVVASGGMGPGRRSAGYNLNALVVTEKDCQAHLVQGESAKMHVGLGGYAGAITEVELDIVHEDPEEFINFLPIKGSSLEKGMTSGIPSIVSRLAPFTKAVKVATTDGPTLRPVVGDLRVKGMEIMTARDMLRAFEFLAEGKDGKGVLGQLAQTMRDGHCAAGLMINGRSRFDRNQINDMLIEALMNSRINGADTDNLFSAIQELVREGVVARDLIETFPGVSMNALRAAREAIAEVARDSKKEGPTQSTDLNLTITGRTEEEIEDAYEVIMEIYSRYIADFGPESRDARIFVYGHCFPGNDIQGEDDSSGGADLHIRITFPLAERDHQKRGSENKAFATHRLAEMYEEFAALDGSHGIRVSGGEKGKLQNPQLTRMMEGKRPEEVKAMFEFIMEHGGLTFAGRNEKFMLHHFPPRIEEGILNYLPSEKSVLAWCKNSHRTPVAQVVFFELQGLIRDYMGLEFNERAFFTESKEEALHSALGALNNYKNNTVLDLRGGMIPSEEAIRKADTLVTDNPDDLDDLRFGGIRKVLVMDSCEAVPAETRKKASAIVYSAESFGSLGGLGVVVTNITAIERERELKALGLNTGFTHSFDRMNENPSVPYETPRMEAEVDLAKAVATMLGQVCTLSQAQIEAREKELMSSTTFNPGPCEVAQTLINGAEAINEMARLTCNEAGTRREIVNRVREKLKLLLEAPSDYEVFFTGSATKAMEQIIQSLGLGHSIVVNNGPFADRMFSVVSAFSPITGPRKTKHDVKMRWGTGPNSRMESIIEEIEARFPASLRETVTGLLLTGNETGPGVTTNTSEVTGRLDKPEILTIVDSTSEWGAVRRFGGVKHQPDVNFGSFQKIIGLPSGIGAILASPRAMEQAAKETRRRAAANGKSIDAPVFRTFEIMQREIERGAAYPDLRSILQLERVLDEFLEQGGIATIERSAGIKAKIFEDTIERSPHLDFAVPDKRDRSGVMQHFLPIDREQADIRRRMAEAGFPLGNGYGPLSGETMRSLTASPHISIDTAERAARTLERAADVAAPANPKRPTLSRRIKEKSAGV